MPRSQSLAIVICGFTLLAFWGILRPEAIHTPRSPEPTATAVLAQLDEWGAKYKLNKHDQVYWLWLKRLPLSDDDLEILHELPQVKVLNMRGIHDKEGNAFTDEGMRHLVGLKKLEQLDLSANYFLTDECSQWLGQVTSLKLLTISQTKITETSLPNLSHLHNLRSFYCNGMRLSESTVPHFRKMPLKKLSGIRIAADDRHLLPQLRHLEQFPSDPIDPTHDLRDIDLVHFRHIKKIHHLRVSLTNGWSDASQLHHLQALPHLENLAISTRLDPTADIDREGIRSLARVPSLRKLSPSRIRDGVLEALSLCPQIRLLDLTSPANRISAEGLKSLQLMQNLKALSLHRTAVNDQTIEALSGIASLEMLVLDGNSLYPNSSSGSYWKPIPRKFSLESLELLSRLPRLKALSVDFWGLGDEAIETLSRVKTLQGLSIADSCADRGSGILISEPALLKLRQLPRLEFLNLYGTSTARSSAELLHKFLPECYITDNWCCGCLSIGPVQPFYDMQNVSKTDR